MYSHTYLHCVCIVVTMCSVSVFPVFPEDEGGRSSKMMVTAYQTAHNNENYTLEVKVWFRLSHLYTVAALHAVTLL